MEKFIPHKHICEIKLCFPSSWEGKCPLNGNLSVSEDECEQCGHFITINFDPDEPYKIIGIIRNEGMLVAEKAHESYKTI